MNLSPNMLLLNLLNSGSDYLVFLVANPIMTKLVYTHITSYFMHRGVLPREINYNYRISIYHVLSYFTYFQ